MMTNVGVIDAALRLVLGLALLGWAFGYYGAAPPVLAAWGATVLGFYPAITGLLRFCPLFAALGISTCAEEI
jgi:Protein of unknown function (DUF2892)